MRSARSQAAHGVPHTPSMAVTGLRLNRNALSIGPMNTRCLLGLLLALLIPIELSAQTV